MQAARKIRPPLKAATIETLIGLLAVTGMRIGEAIALDRDDVELAEGRLIVRRDKNGKSREIALHPSTVDRARRLRPACATSCARTPRTRSFLITAAGRATAPRDRVARVRPASPRTAALTDDTLGRRSPHT